MENKDVYLNINERDLFTVGLDQVEMNLEFYNTEKNPYILRAQSDKTTFADINIEDVYQMKKDGVTLVFIKFSNEACFEITTGKVYQYVNGSFYNAETGTVITGKIKPLNNFDDKNYYQKYGNNIRNAFNIIKMLHDQDRRSFQTRGCIEQYMEDEQRGR